MRRSALCLLHGEHRTALVPSMRLPDHTSGARPLSRCQARVPSRHTLREQDVLWKGLPLPVPSHEGEKWGSERAETCRGHTVRRWWSQVPTEMLPGSILCILDK